MLKRALIITVFFCLLGCQAPIQEPFQFTDFRNETPITIPVADIQVINQTVRYTELPHLETRIPVTPVYALSSALKNRFAPQKKLSNTGVTFTIKTADLIQKKQEAPHWYILDNIEYFLEYQIEVTYSKAGSAIETQNISGWEKQAIPKRSSLREKEEVWQKMINAMIQKTTDKIQADMPPASF